MPPRHQPCGGFSLHSRIAPQLGQHLVASVMERSTSRSERPKCSPTPTGSALFAEEIGSQRKAKVLATVQKLDSSLAIERSSVAQGPSVEIDVGSEINFEEIPEEEILQHTECALSNSVAFHNAGYSACPSSRTPLMSALHSRLHRGAKIEQEGITMRKLSLIRSLLRIRLPMLQT